MVTLVPFSSEKGLFSVEMIEEALSLSLSLQDLRFLKIKEGYTV